MQRFNSFYCSSVLLLSLSASLGCGQTDGSGGPSTPPKGTGGPGPVHSGTGGTGSTTGSATTGGQNSNSSSTPTRGFNGAPGTTGFVPLSSGCGPSTRLDCSAQCQARDGDSTVLRPPAALCFVSDVDPTPSDPIALIEQVIEEIEGQRLVHLRVTFDPAFVDNTYGSNAVGWDHGATLGGTSGVGGGAAGGSSGAAPMPDGKVGGMGMKPGPGKSGHTFDDLVGSDHVELKLTDGNGATVLDFKLDYITAQNAAKCGYANLGVSGGEGKMITGSSSAIVSATSSLDRNLNGCGYCLTEDSPATDANYTVNSQYPNWDYRVVYEVWLRLDDFGSAGFGQAYIDFVHASPSKLDDNTAVVEPGPCPPSWDSPYCPPGSQTGVQCQTGNSCPPNQQIYIQTEGKSVCTPIPFANYPNKAPCPTGYQLDAATEGRYCVPE